MSEVTDQQAEQMGKCLTWQHEVYCELAKYGSVRLAVCRHCGNVYMIKDTK